MNIKKLEASNFRSFDELNIELGKLNILIGANASGKSNFVEIFRFLRDITNLGLRNAISMQGGIEFLRNISLQASKDLAMKITYEFEEGFGIENEGRLIEAKTNRLTYEFAMHFTTGNGGFAVCKDELTREYSFVELAEEKDGEIVEKEEIGSGTVTLSSVDGKLRYNVDLPPLLSSLNIQDLTFFMPPSGEARLPAKTLLLQTPFFLAPTILPGAFGDILVYNFDPKLPRRSTPITGKGELEEDGSNLAIVLKTLLEDDEKGRKFTNLVQDLLPFVEHLRVERFMDKSLFFALREQYNKDVYLPASLLSDGTIAVTAFIVALYFEPQSLTIFEEPTRNIHPALISKMVGMMKEVSEKKQIIVTTHNPQVVKHAGLDNLLLISRGGQGFSAISKPGSKEDVRVFLENEVGIDELFVQGLLGA